MTSQDPRVMKAKIVEDRWKLDETDLIRVIETLKGGGLVVYPTETLYGLGVDPYDEEAVERLFKVKRRPWEDPVALVVSGLEEAERLAYFSQRALDVWRAFMPGPLTLILRAKAEAPPPPVTKEGALGLRMPRHDVPLLLGQEFGPFTATSANLHGGPPPRTFGEAYSQLGGEVDLLIDAGTCPLGRESTVLELIGDQPTIKREGALAREELERHG